jgi:hypothetical protein
MNRPDDRLLTQWHSAINAYHFEGGDKVNEYQPWMYLAMHAMDELPRLAMLFKMEREGKLVKVHHQCSHDVNGTKIPDNQLVCALGKDCRDCPYLKALDKAKVTDDKRDQMKAWTCVTHIIQEAKDGAIDTTEGFILTIDDILYWNTIYASLANASEEGDTNDPHAE